jgi:hypothetical protein
MNFCVYLSHRHFKENKFVQLFLSHFVTSQAPENFIVIKIENIFFMLIFSILLKDVEDPTKFLPFINTFSQKYF